MFRKYWMPQILLIFFYCRGSWGSWGLLIKSRKKAREKDLTFQKQQSFVDKEQKLGYGHRLKQYLGRKGGSWTSKSSLCALHFYLYTEEQLQKMKVWRKETTSTLWEAGSNQTSIRIPALRNIMPPELLTGSRFPLKQQILCN